LTVATTEVITTMKMVAVEDNNSKMSIQAADRDHVGWEQQTEPGGRALGSLQSDVEWDPLHFSGKP